MPYLLRAPAPDSGVEPGPRPSLSVIVAAYNVTDVIADALDSVFAQSRAPDEVIVCDDGSTDDLAGALGRYRDRITFLRKPHGGEASAKNMAAEAAHGDFVVILDADDVFLPSRLEAIADASAARPDLDIITTDAYLEAEGSIVRRCYDGSWTFETDDQRGELMRRNFVFGLAAVRRELLLRHGGFDESILWTTDWDCWIRLVLDGAKIGCIDEPLAHYRVREASLSARREDMARGKIATLEKTSRDLRLTDTERRTLARSVAAYRRELALLETRRAISAHGKEARSQARAIALAGGYGWRARLEAALMALAPARAQRRLQRAELTAWVGAGGTRVLRRQP